MQKVWRKIVFAFFLGVAVAAAALPAAGVVFAAERNNTEDQQQPPAGDTDNPDSGDYAAHHGEHHIN